MGGIENISLRFIRTELGDLAIHQHTAKAYDCRLYEVKNNDTPVAKMYFSKYYALLETPNRLVRIERQSHLFKKTTYQLYSHTTNECIGYLRYPFWQWGDKAKCFVHFTDNTVYSFKQCAGDGSIFDEKAGTLQFEMTSHGCFVFYEGSLSLQFVNDKEQQIFEGGIQLDSGQPLPAVITGLYIIEEMFRQNKANRD